MKTLGNVFLFLLLIVVAFLNSLLTAYVVLDLGELYKLPFITSLNFVQLIGIFYVLSLVLYKVKSNKDTTKEKTFSAFYKKAYGQVFEITLFVLINWGLAILAFKMLS